MQREGGGVTKGVCVTAWVKLEKSVLAAIFANEFILPSRVIDDKTIHLPMGSRNDRQPRAQG